MQSNDAIGELVTRTGEWLRSVADPALVSVLSHWPQARELSRGTAPLPNPPPVVSWLPRITVESIGPRRCVLKALDHAAVALAWRQTYSVEQVGAEFMRNYAWTLLVGPGAPAPSARLACGFLLLGPRTIYPPHSHEAEEWYLPLSGTAQWQRGDAPWQEREPGNVIHHHSDESHAMRTADQPLLALYLWRSANLAQKARLHV